MRISPFSMNLTATRPRTMDKLKPQKLITLILLIGIIAPIFSPAGAGDNNLGPASKLGRDPLNATYLIDGEMFQLIDGQCETAVAPGSATRIKTTVLGNPVYGDMTGDGNRDAAVLLSHDPGGSGTFYYAAAALHVDNRYQGTNAVLIGDRIAPHELEITNGIIKIAYADRFPNEPLSAKPLVARRSVLILSNDLLEVVSLKGDDESVYGGWVIVGHEVRAFEPCEGQQALWLMGNGAALKEIINAYNKALPMGKPYQKLFMLLGGKFSKPPTDGFGAEYEAGFIATQLVSVVLDGSCTSDIFTFISR
jgi:hypothetical protein